MLELSTVSVLVAVIWGLVALFWALVLHWEKSHQAEARRGEVAK